MSTGEEAIATIKGTPPDGEGLRASLEKALQDPKQRIAITSVLAAIFLVSFKLYVGILTNSLGILSEALHSGLDLVAAGITLLAVIASAKPADAEHNFGHGKSENLSALAETILLIATCAWIFYEAYKRIFLESAPVQASLAGFLVMGVSIVIDVNRSRMLYRAAKKYKSQALEADALHFSSDIISSSVVILGLVFVMLGWPIGDPLASTGVGILIVIASLRLGRRTFDALMDSALVTEAERIKGSIGAIEGVSIERLRTRLSGPNAFVDLKISLDRSVTLEDSRGIMSEVEKRVRDVLPGADVVVQVEPRVSLNESLSSKIIQIVANERRIRHIHSIRIHRIDSSTIIDLHLEVDPTLSVKEAHDLASAFEERVKAQLSIDEVNTHIETRELEETNVSMQGLPQMGDRIRAIVTRYPEVVGCHSIQVIKAEGKVSANLHCELLGDEPIEKANEITTIIEDTLRAELELSYVNIHIEPKER
jgi:cation diffusion facilitator family transporter